MKYTGTTLWSIAAVMLTTSLFAQVGKAGRATVASITDNENFEVINVVARVTKFKGTKSLMVVNEDSLLKGTTMVKLKMPSNFKNGIIETRIAGLPTSSASAASRGFVGIAFRVQGDAFECIYIRPTNGRAEDQIRRNHSVQYISHPEYPWHRLRREFPGLYESYVDLVPAEWTDIKIEVNGGTARLYVHQNTQPTLIINDLKHGVNGEGSIGLWIGTETIGYFSDLKITRTDNPD